MQIIDDAQVAYEAYRNHTGGISLASGQPIPEWAQLRPDIQSAWKASADALREQIMCPVHHSLDVRNELDPFDQCVACMRVERNELRKLAQPITGQTSDGYHTFDELYEHRHQLFIALCREVKPRISVFKTKKHSDGTMYDNWFLLMMILRCGTQISYHLPIRLWDECDFSERGYAPVFDGHTSNDVLERLRML